MQEKRSRSGLPAVIFSKPLKVGTPAPPFICPNEEGRVFVLNQQRGKNVVLVFYPGDHTPVCRKQLCEMRDKWELLTEKGVVVFGVNPQSGESHKRFREKFQFPFPLLVDSAKRVAAAYKADGLIVKRTVYLIDKEGVIRFAKRGKPPVEEILAALS
ncbi:MAG: peroxiredoxin [bacterium]|nr:peroxiredoxin [bacterium]